MSPTEEIPQEILNQVLHLHEQVSIEADRIAGGLGELLVCRHGCHDCCIDDLTVFPIEAEIIRRNCGPLLVSDSAHPKGKCAFLDASGGCRIYQWRPYVCRTQGLPLQWPDFDDSGSTSFAKDICPLNLTQLKENGFNLYDLPTNFFWTLGNVESQLASLQVAALGRFEENLPRIFLRNLFKI